MRLTSYTEVRERHRARQQQLSEKTAVFRACTDVWWAARRALYKLRHPWPWTRLRWRWQRAMRGWADCDAWSLDSYVTGIVAQALPRVAVHGYPGEYPYHTHELWQQHVRELAAEFGAWNEDTFLEEDAFRRAKLAWHMWAENFGMYWD